MGNDFVIPRYQLRARTGQHVASVSHLMHRILHRQIEVRQGSSEGQEEQQCKAIGGLERWQFPEGEECFVGMKMVMESGEQKAMGCHSSPRRWLQPRLSVGQGVERTTLLAVIKASQARDG